MASIASAPHLPSIGSHARQEAGNQLQATLVELADLALIGKQLHWSVVGALFRPLHLQLDELVDAWRDLSDTVAERAVAIGFWPDGQSSAITASSGLRELKRGPWQDHAVVRELTTRLAEIAERVRERIDRLGELDIGSQDVLIEVVRALEEQLWMIRAQLSTDRGS